LVEQLTLNQLVLGSSPRSGTIDFIFATLAQLVEHPPCKRTVVGSIPTGGSISFQEPQDSIYSIRSHVSIICPCDHLGYIWILTLLKEKIPDAVPTATISPSWEHVSNAG